MITLKDIKIAVNSTLISEFGYEINSNDVEEGFIRPSFFVALENSKRSENTTQMNRSLTITIYFFPSDRYSYSVEVLDVQEQLENVFNLKLSVKGRQFNILESQSSLTDGVLSFYFDIDYHEGKEYTEAQVMEKLEYDERVN